MEATGAIPLLSIHKPIWSLLYFRIFSGPSVEPQPHYAEESLAENAATHLACSLAAVDKYHWNFFYLKANLISGVLHFYLETIAFETHFVERDGLKYLPAIALKAGCGVVYGETSDETHILRCENNSISTRPMGQFTTFTPLT